MSSSPHLSRQSCSALVHTTGAITPQTDAGDSEAEDIEKETTRGNEDRTAAEIAARIEVNIIARGD